VFECHEAKWNSANKKTEGFNDREVHETLQPALRSATRARTVDVPGNDTKKKINKGTIKYGEEIEDLARVLRRLAPRR
jgi:hypothetical protein